MITEHKCMQWFLRWYLWNWLVPSAGKNKEQGELNFQALIKRDLLTEECEGLALNILSACARELLSLTCKEF